jgi:hypothetical protein
MCDICSEDSNGKQGINNLCCSPDTSIIEIIKSRRMRWEGHKSAGGRINVAYMQNLVGILKL